MYGALHCLVGEPEVSTALIDAAEAAGLPADCCSADKQALGAMLGGHFPRPSCHVGINTPCDSQVVATQAMAEIEPAPQFVIDVPYYDDDRSIHHVAAQLAELVPFLERHIGQRLSWDRLARVCERMNRASAALWDWMEWRRHVPVVQPSRMVSLGTLPLMVLFSGTRAGVDIAEGLALEARERAESGEVWFEERVRAIWYQDPIWWDFQMYDWMEAELGLTIPMDLFGWYAPEAIIDTRSEEGMLFGLARKLMRNMPMSRQFRGNIERYVTDYLDIHEAFSADCAIFAGHVACKHAWAGLGLFREALRRAGIPLLVFPFDMFDPRVTSYDEVFAELSRFVEDVVLPGKRRRGRC